MMIRIELGASVTTSVEYVKCEDLGVTELEWSGFNDEYKKEVLTEYINSLNDQPYWMLDSFEESEIH